MEAKAQLECPMVVKDFLRPKRLESDPSVSSKTYGKFVVEPFERGFGTTIGNSLRRTLLSALPGVAITAVKIEGVYHEFSTIPGIVEDTTDIILNLKLIRMRMVGDGLKEGPRKIRLEVKNRNGTITSKDIVCDPSVEILNPDQHICTMDGTGNLEMEMDVEIGRGYVPAEQNKKDNQPIGVIPIDSIFSPIKRANFRVEDGIMGKNRIYDRLILDVWTDGSYLPEDAIACAAKLLKDYWQIFINFDEPEEEEKEKKDDETAKLREILDKSVNELELSVRSYNCLKNADIKTIRELVLKTESEMLKTKNFGRKSLNEIREILTDMGLGLGMKPEDIPE
jgi:DNA-directed RNA polymerase subunit alpha